MKRRICEFVMQVEGTRCMHVTASVDDVERESPGQLLMNSWAEHTNYQLGHSAYRTQVTCQKKYVGQNESD